MTKKLSNPKPEAEVLDLFPRPVFLPDEDPLAYEALHGALTRELDPATPYEKALATNLALLEWEAIRHRRLRDLEIIAAFIDTARERLLGNGSTLNKPAAAELQAARDLCSDDPVRRRAAEAQFQGRGWNVSELLARGYGRRLPVIERHEDRIAEIKLRRRRLREEYYRLKQLRQHEREKRATVIDA